MYYKLIQNNKIIAVVKNPHFIKIYSNDRISVTDEGTADGLLDVDTQQVYSFKGINNKNIPIAYTEKIDKSEFNRLTSLLNSDKIVYNNDQEISLLRQQIIKELSATCHTKIVEGFEIKLSDNKAHKFTLTAEDQINLLNLESQLNTPLNTFLYHASNEPCKYFSREDIEKVIARAKKHILYHTTYFNVAKQYLSNIHDFDRLKSFSYGQDVSAITQDLNIKQILRGNFK